MLLHELSYRNDRKQKRTCYIREYMEQYRKKKTSDVKVKNSESAQEKESTKKLKSCNIKNDKVMKLIQSFHSTIEVGAEYACTCCDQLWYRSSVEKCSRKVYSNCCASIVNSVVTSVKSVGGIEWICLTCDSNLKRERLPCCAKANKISFPVKSDVLELTSLEERLVAPRICLMQLRELPRGGQLKISGGVVDVPANVNSTITCLPRSLNETYTVPIKLKRRLGYKHHYQFEFVRPKRVLNAPRYLAKTSTLFKYEG